MADTEHRYVPGYVPVYTTEVVDQDVAAYTAEDQATWAALMERQMAILPERACPEHRIGLDLLGITNSKTIPVFKDLSARLEELSGWTLVGVHGLLPAPDFFDHLAHCRFPVTVWIRDGKRLDYLPEPDLFHDLFGHVPLLCNPLCAQALAAYGQAAARVVAAHPDAWPQLSRLYWYTVEFGLLNTPEGLRIYGAGILSSAGESVYCLGPEAHRVGFSVDESLRSPYVIDDFQRKYFILPDFETLLKGLSEGPDQAILALGLADIE